MQVRILNGDSINVLKDMADNSVDSVVTDPPYGLSFMGKKWDYDVPSVELWREVLRVLKPGGHLLSFGGTRTYHRMVVNIEDAGFEIRDCIQWIYGSGFPKSQNIAIQIDKQAGAMGHRGKALDMAGPGERNDIHTDQGSQSAPAHIPITDAAKTWSGFGTALKPANEPIVVARKPISESTIAKNVLVHGTGGLNIDGSRIGTETIKIDHKIGNSNSISYKDKGEGPPKFSHSTYVTGRWPANVIFDEDAAAVLDEQSIAGGIHSAGKKRDKGAANQTANGGVTSYVLGQNPNNGMRFEDGENIGASRFFYVAKASKRERGEGNNHPTVKPIKLMEYLVKLVTPPNGTVLDPFCGSGTTGVACKNAGFEFIGIEREQAYVEIAQKRLSTNESETA